MKKKLTFLAVALSCAVIFGIAGCAAPGGTVSDPVQAIKESYGNREFTVSFSSENLSEPIADISYSAYSMPQLPTPRRVGYIFEGWYLDKNFSTPYSDGILYLYMTDITLYAKWSKEEFTADGTYDVELSAEIVEGSLSLGALAEEYGYKNFTESIIAEGTYIEKSESGLQLKIEYDCGTTVPFGQTAVYTVIPAVEMGSSVYIAEKITPDNDSIHSLIFNIDNFDITQPLYLDVTAYNWEAGLSSDRVAKTRADYTVKLTVSRLIGFSKSYIDPDLPAEEGYYLVKTHFIKENGESSMMESYNSIYSYVHVDGEGNYTLIKPFTPYAGMIGTSGVEFPAAYYSRAMTYAPIQLYYGITVPQSQGGEIKSDYFPQYYSAEYYGEYTMEFHADTGRYYMLYDLGGSFKRQFMLKGATTGFMEMTFGMGAYNVVMTLDYDHIIKLNEIDYTPLSGENYAFGDKFNYYTGSLSDLNSRNLVKDAVEEYGFSNEMINLFYSAPADGSSYSQRTMYSFRMTVTPTASTNAVAVKDARYRIAEFDVAYNVYGYSAQSGKNLYADSMTVNAFGTSGNARREEVQIVNGKSVNVGDKIWFNELYAQKVDANGAFGGENVTVYPLNADGTPDYRSGKSVSVNSAYTFMQNIAVLYEDGNEHSLIYLKQYSAPVYRIINTEDNKYSEYGHTVSDTINFPALTYTFMGNGGSFYDYYYENDKDEMCVDPTRVGLYTVSDGSYSLAYVNAGITSFAMKSTHMAVAYELRNEFGEVYILCLDFYAESQTKYTITEDGESIVSGTVRYDGKTGERVSIVAGEQYTRILGSVSEAESIAEKTFEIRYGDNVIPLSASQCALYAGGSYTLIEGDVFGRLYELLKNCDYAIFTLVWSNGEDYIKISYEYGLKFSGKNDLSAISYDDVFTGYEYYIAVPAVSSADGTVLAQGTLSLRYNSGSVYLSAGSAVATVQQTGNFCKVIFNQPGRYAFIYDAVLKYDEYGNRLFEGESISIKTVQYFTVEDGTGDVTVTYVTDTDHPFASGTAYTEVYDESGVLTGYAYTLRYNLNSSIITLGQTGNFAYEGTDRLYGWFTRSDYDVKDADSAFYRGTLIADFIGSFNSKEVTLYAFWDEGKIVTIDRNEELTGLKPLVKTLWLSRSTYQNGTYSFSISGLEISEPSGYVNKGWLVGGQMISAENTNYTIYYTDNSPLEVSVVFAKEYKVRYIVNSAYSSSRFGDATAVEGAAADFPEVSAFGGYKFVGWKLVERYTSNTDYTAADELFDTLMEIDDSNALCNIGGKQSVIFAAVFEDAEGNMVW